MVLSKRFFTPHCIILLTHGVSFLCWGFPSFGFLRKGYDTPLPLFSTGGILFLLAMASAAIVSLLFYRAGTFFGCGDRVGAVADCRTVAAIHRIVVILACIGVGTALVKIVSANGTIAFIFLAIKGGSANSLKESLYENYSIGIVSLRYLAIPAFALSVYKKSLGGRFSLYDLLAATALLSVMIISSRLSLVSATFISFYLVVNRRGAIRLRFGRIGVFILLMFLLLAALNHSRNSSYYDERRLGFFSSAFSEIITYVGTPFQGGIVSFEYPAPELAEIYYAVSTIEEVLNTNSSFMELIASWGGSGYFLGLVSLALFSAVSGYLSRSGEVALQVINGIILYCFAEFWRVFMFNKGITVTMILSVFLAWQLLRGGRLLRRGLLSVSTVEPHGAKPASPLW